MSPWPSRTSPTPVPGELLRDDTVEPRRGPRAVLASDPPAPSGPRPAPLASTTNLSVSFERAGRTVRSLREVTLEIQPGEILGLVGESGSGKSVLGLTLLGLHPPGAARIEGEIRVLGEDLTTASADTWRRLRRTHLGAVFQDPMTSLNPTMRIGRQVTEAGVDTDEAEALLRALGIPDARRRLASFPHELSGGLRQRVMIALAIARRPSLIVADEPTTALDVTVQAQILALLRSLRDDHGTAMLFITHDLGVASQIADRIAVLYGGRLMEVGPATSLLDQPAHPYAAGLLTARLTLTSDRSRPVAALPGEPPNPVELPTGCPFAPRCALAEEACTASPPELTEIAPGWSLACVRPDTTPEQAGEARPEWSAGELGHGIALLATDVHKRFRVRQGLRARQLHSLRGVDLEIREGEAVALVGESGSGKSTLLRVVAGLTPADQGSIEVGGAGRPQMVFQDAGASLTPWLNVGSLLDERARHLGLARRERARRVEEVLSLVGLPGEVARAKPRQLSGGQRQRVGLARAIVVPPPLLLCDEPTSALDVSLAATVLNLIGRLRRELSMAVLFVTHDLSVARLIGDRIAVMYLGRIVETGRIEEVVASPRHPYTAALLAAVPEPGRTLEPVAGEPASPLAPPPGCAFAPRCARADDACRASDPRLSAPGIDDPALAARTNAVACLHPLGAAT